MAEQCDIRPGDMKLSPAQNKLLDAARKLSAVAPSRSWLLVSGHEYRTAEALERKGMGELRYQAPGMGWFYGREEE